MSKGEVVGQETMQTTTTTKTTNGTKTFDMIFHVRYLFYYFYTPFLYHGIYIIDAIYDVKEGTCL